MESSVPGVFGLVNRTLLRLRIAALGEALAAPAAGFLLVAAALLAAARASGRADLPRGVLAATAALALLAMAARLFRFFPRFEDAALHLDRSLAAGERFTTVVETAERDPAIAEWAARGALERATAEGLRQALALRPPAALLPMLLAATVVAGLVLLPAPPPAGAAVPTGATAAAGGAGTGSRSGATAAATPATTAERGGTSRTDPTTAVADMERALYLLESWARERNEAAVLREVAAAREDLARGDEGAARDAMNRAFKVGGFSASDAGSVAAGATGGGEASISPAGAPRESGQALRPLPVPLRAREAVRNYFGNATKDAPR